MTYQPRGLSFDQFNAGDEWETASRTVTEADIVNFAGLSGDFNPLHTDEEFARGTPFGGRIAHGVLGLAVATGLANQLGIFEGTTIAVLEMVTRFTGAVRPGDTVNLSLKIAEKKESRKTDRGIIQVAVNLANQRRESVMQGQWTIMMARERSNPNEAG